MLDADVLVADPSVVHADLPERCERSGWAVLSGTGARGGRGRGCGILPIAPAVRISAQAQIQAVELDAGYFQPPAQQRQDLDAQRRVSKRNKGFVTKARR